MSIVDEMVFKRFTILYGDPKTSDVESFFAEYETALKGYSEHILTEAVNRVIKANEFRSWPMPGEICKAASEIGAAISRYARQTYVAPAEPALPLPDPESIDRVKALVAQFAAKRAPEETIGIWQPDVTRPAMEEMQINSPNRFHRKGEIRS